MHKLVHQLQGASPPTPTQITTHPPTHPIPSPVVHKLVHQLAQHRLQGLGRHQLVAGLHQRRQDLGHVALVGCDILLRVVDSGERSLAKLVRQYPSCFF